MQRMKTFITGWFAAVVLALVSMALPAHAQLAVGRDYTVIEPAQGTDDPGRIEVVEFFSYACSHCNEFHPHVSKWASKLPGDVTFKRVPVSFNRPGGPILPGSTTHLKRPVISPSLTERSFMPCTTRV